MGESGATRAGLAAFLDNSPRYVNAKRRYFI